MKVAAEANRFRSKDGVIVEAVSFRKRRLSFSVRSDLVTLKVMSRYIWLG
jgi:hypothetical protein